MKKLTTPVVEECDLYFIQTQARAGNWCSSTGMSDYDQAVKYAEYMRTLGHKVRIATKTMTIIAVED